jgi:hypothetical protein
MSLQWHYHPEVVVQQAIDCFPEMEAWWANRDEGPHIDMVQ